VTQQQLTYMVHKYLKPRLNGTAMDPVPTELICPICEEYVHYEGIRNEDSVACIARVQEKTNEIPHEQGCYWASNVPLY
jgi:hypothetical protein